MMPAIQDFVALHHAAANNDDCDQLVATLRAELYELEAVTTAAVLTATAFRLRDEQALVEALRQLTTAVVDLERTRDRED